MLKIRKEQMEVFERVAALKFEDGTIEYLKQFYPKHCETLGDDGVRSVIRYGWEKAKGYGLTSERSVRIYIALMFILGSDFDTDLQLPWAAEILKDESIEDESMRIDDLYDQTMYYLDRVAGVDNECRDEAFSRLSQERMEDLSEFPAGRLEDQIARRLRRIFPEKYEYIGEDCISQLIDRGIESAKSYGIPTGHGFGVFISLMFMLGSSFHTDLLFPWIEPILKDDTITSHDEKVDRLHTETMTHLEEWLA